MELLFNKGVLIASFFVLMFVLERVFSATPAFGSRTRIGRNLGLAAINILLSPIIVIPLTAWFASHAFHWRPVAWHGALGLMMDLLLLDLWIYWWHRANHVVPFLWRWHEVHHLDETLDTTSALRFHFGEVALSACVRGLVILVLAVPLSSVVVFEALVAIAAVFHHSNLRLPRRFEALLSGGIVTPSIHWVHHHAVREDTDSNYGTVLSVWDVVFRSRSRTQRSIAMPIGVEGRRDATLPQLIVRPLAADKASD
jgi:sterol desaturase/sphingolipid hydroxylase (fatty acid hydroxylase superfamily)